jgi:hypothetical protein
MPGKGLLLVWDLHMGAQSHSLVMISVATRAVIVLLIGFTAGVVIPRQGGSRASRHAHSRS